MYDSQHSLYQDAVGDSLTSQEQYYYSTLAILLQHRLTDNARQKLDAEELYTLSRTLAEKHHLKTTDIDIRTTGEIESLAEDALFSIGDVELTTYVRNHDSGSLDSVDKLIN